ncbi:hypothetical protein IQ266_22055 [filamentous cyanobacterium LEGE 11480]|uniref:Uncharacterized protein n=1 Tax=Romeriopsis navalis LEGE 11480 TaxID=2777977 RepID=A0A928VTR4_9CYAN|nr:hypothetical protein [Romeriopsis navalis]MBE9032425.1 hypothetical protein [Romeriopsis navalis LEGE 11480]
MPVVNVRTIGRDVTIVQKSNLYAIEIKIYSGGGRITPVDVEDFLPPEEVLNVWKNLGSKTKPPQMRLFELLDQAVKTLTEERRRIYDAHTVHLGLERVVGGSQLVDFQRAFEALQAQSRTLLREVLREHAYAKSQWLNQEIRPLLEAGRFSSLEVRERLNQYAMRFPAYEKIEAKFGIQLKFNPTSSFHDLIQRDTAWQQQMADRASAEADWINAETQRDEAIAAQRAVRYQEQRLRSAIDEKVAEVRGQMLSVLHDALQRVSDAGWNAGAMPNGMQQRLKALAESAQVLSVTDHSLATMVEQINGVRSIGARPSENENALQNQVAALLGQLNHQMQQQTTELLEDADSGFDRSDFVDWV